MRVKGHYVPLPAQSGERGRGEEKSNGNVKIQNIYKNKKKIKEDRSRLTNIQ